MQAAMQFDLIETVPVHPSEQQLILRLHVRQEAMATSGIGAGDGQPDQRRAEDPDAPVRRCHSQTRAPPYACVGLMDAHGADDLIGFPGYHRYSDEGYRDRIDVVPVTAGEDLLFFTEYGVAELRCGLDFPGFTRNADEEAAAQKGRWSCKVHQALSTGALCSFSNVDRAEQAPHLAQPAFTSSAASPPSRSIWASGPRTDSMKSGLGEG